MKIKNIPGWVKVLLPGLFGILIYLTIRVLTDTASGFDVFQRDIWFNLSELLMSFVVGYLFHFILQWYLRKQRNKKSQDYSFNSLVSEFFVLWFYMLITINSTVTVWTTFTDDGLSLHDFVIINIVPSLYVMLYFAIVRGNEYFKGFVDNQIKLEKVAKENIETELKFLRNQFHPHFLFNALNTIYFQMDEDVMEAKKTVEQFSKLLRYQIYDYQDGKVLLSREFEYLENYINVMKVRKNNSLILSSDLDPGLKDYAIYPFLLQPLVENAFKYVGGKEEIKIRAKKVGDQLEFIVENSCFPNQKANKRDANSGIGIKNLKRRLTLLYPEKHDYHSENRGDNYYAHLKLALNEKN